MSKELRIGMIGYAFMGAAHSQAWRTAPHFFDLPLHPVMRVVAGRDAARAATAAQRLGWAGSTGRWQDLLDRDDIGLIDVCSPGDTHAEVAIAALDAGKHVLCEKPLANTVDEAVAMADAAERAGQRGVRAMVAFNYRRVPAVALARQLVAGGRLGQIRHVRAVYLQDWIVDPEFPLVWRLQAERSGSGALGDLGAHIVDVAQFVIGDTLRGVSALTETFIRERPLPDASAGLSASGSGGATGEVTVDDATLFLGRPAARTRCAWRSTARMGR
jgi:predicted dehydrogenase